MEFDLILKFLVFFPVFLFALSFHECAHARAAFYFGDDTGQKLGRMTLNPIPHIDVVGTLIFPIMLFFTGIPIPLGGWAKPVPVSVFRLKNPRKDMLWIALAGPLSNLFLFALSLICFRFLIYILGSPLLTIELSSFQGSVIKTLLQMLMTSIWVNAGLAVFNMLPLHPLDGGKVLEGLLPHEWVEPYNQVARYGFLIIFALYYLGLFKLIFAPMTWVVQSLLGV